jgi:FkbM family methyltransferase
MVKCIAIDGSFLALAKLKKNLERNPSIHVKIASCALASENKLQCVETAAHQNLGSTKLIDDQFGENPTRFWVASMALQEVLERLAPGQIRLLKIDVEGFELSVFKGLDFNGPFRPANLIVECYTELFPQASDCFEFLLSQGYEAMTVEGTPIRECRNLPEENVWFRCASRANEKALSKSAVPLKVG